MDWMHRICVRILGDIHCHVMGIPGMTWTLNNMEVITTIVAITMPIAIIATLVLMASGKTHDAHELKGFPDERE